MVTFKPGKPKVFDFTNIDAQKKLCADFTTLRWSSDPHVLALEFEKVAAWLRRLEMRTDIEVDTKHVPRAFTG